jgi:hypothetical protein
MCKAKAKRHQSHHAKHEGIQHVQKHDNVANGGGEGMKSKKAINPFHVP